MTVVVKLEFEDKDDDMTEDQHKELIADDIKSELDCCWHDLEIKSIEFC